MTESVRQSRLERNTNSFIANVDRQRGKIWDRIVLPSGAWTNLSFFQFPIGSLDERGIMKLPIHTNMQKARELPPPQCFLTERIIFTFSKSCDPRDVVSAVENMAFRFYIQDKCFATALLCHMQSVKEPLSPIRICDFCKAVFVQSLQCPGCGARSFVLSTLGEADSGQQYAMDLTPKYIPPMTSFRVGFSADPDLRFHSEVVIWCTFEGQEDVSVQ